MRLKINVFSTYPLHKEARPNVHVSTNTGTDHPYHIYIRKGSDTTWTTVVPHTTRCNHRIKDSLLPRVGLPSKQLAGIGWLIFSPLSPSGRTPLQQWEFSVWAVDSRVDSPDLESDSSNFHTTLSRICETRGQRHWKEIKVLTKTNSGATVTDSTLKNIELNGPHLS